MIFDKFWHKDICLMIYSAEFQCETTTFTMLLNQIHNSHLKIYNINLDLNGYTPKIRYEDLLLSVAKNTYTLLNHTQTKPHQTLIDIFKEPKETSSSNTPMETERLFEKAKKLWIL